MAQPQETSTGRDADRAPDPQLRAMIARAGIKPEVRPGEMGRQITTLIKELLPPVTDCWPREEAASSSEDVEGDPPVEATTTDPNGKMVTFRTRGKDKVLTLPTMGEDGVFQDAEHSFPTHTVISFTVYPTPYGAPEPTGFSRYMGVTRTSFWVNPDGKTPMQRETSTAVIDTVEGRVDHAGEIGGYFKDGKLDLALYQALEAAKTADAPAEITPFGQEIPHLLPNPTS